MSAMTLLRDCDPSSGKFQSDRAREHAKARRTDQDLERRIPLLVRKDKSGLGVATLGGIIANQERNGCPREAGCPACLQCTRNQRLHQAAAAMGGIGRDMLDHPVALAALHPAATNI